MSQHRTWDENQSPQWKYLFQKEAQSKRKTRKELNKERDTKKREEEEKYANMTKYGVSRVQKEKREKKGTTRKVTKEELQNKLKKALQSKSTIDNE